MAAELQLSKPDFSFSLPSAAAFSAHALTACRNVGIRTLEWMTMNAMRFAGMVRCGIGAAQDVLADRYWLKMRGPDAQSYPTKMIELFTGLDLAVFLLPCPAMSRNRSTVARQRKLPVVTTVARMRSCRPYPASAQMGGLFGNSSALVNLFPESLMRISVSGHEWIIT